MSSATTTNAHMTPILTATTKVYDLVIVMPVYEDREAAGQLFRAL
jgi:hypothetical protein